MLALTDITLNYEGRTILNNACLNVARGEIVSLVGPSGSGKTTLLRVIAGLEQPGQGTVVIDNQLMTGVPTHKRNVGLVFQDNQLFPHLSIFDNIAYSLRIQRVAKALQVEQVNEMLSLIGMEDLARRDVGQLSGGEAKRVAVARALVANPLVLLLDEPLTGLDAELHERLLGDMGALLRARGTTVVHVTHDHNEATRLSDRVVDIRMLGQSGVQLQ
ncbi:MAG: ABC transporter ATP-binding protein [Actinobacteria bacterium]|nr:MAG: ABC transporter ATP-binding protein [Actinomycetota bacterium]